MEKKWTLGADTYPSSIISILGLVSPTIFCLQFKLNEKICSDRFVRIKMRAHWTFCVINFSEMGPCIKYCVIFDPVIVRLYSLTSYWILHGVQGSTHSTSTTRCIAKINQILYTCQFARLNNLWEASNEITMEVSVLCAAKLPVSTSYWIKLITVNINKISGKKTQVLPLYTGNWVIMMPTLASVKAWWKNTSLVYISTMPRLFHQC